MISLFDDPRLSASLFYPRRELIRSVAGARDLRVEVAPDLRLHLRVHDAPDALALVLLFHGNGETVSDYDSSARNFASLVRASLAIVDYRGYGASQGTPTLRDCLLDAPKVLDAAREAVPGLPVVVMGRSLGGFSAAELCQQARTEVRGFVFESAPSDLYAGLHRWDVPLDGPLPEDDLATFCPLRKFRRCTTPSLVLHGERDTLIVAVEARQAFEALATSDKELVLIPGRGHNDVSFHPVYWDSLARFVARVAT